MKTVLIYIDNNREVGDIDHLSCREMVGGK
jgi:hypothetical protein